MEFNLERLNNKKIELGEKPLTLVTTTYNDIVTDGTYLLDKNGNRIGTKGDMYTKVMLNDILQRGCLDHNPRPHYKDGTPAHTLSLNHGQTTSGIFTYDISKGETPLITLRPIATESAVKELFWIYKDQTTNLDVLANYGVTWWDEWELGDTRSIGATYGDTVRRYDLMNKLLKDLVENPDNRRNIISLWQEEQFKLPHGLKPCAYLVTFNLRHGWDGKIYLDMSLKQRSSDFCVAGCINQVQYLVLLYLVARHIGAEVGQFTWHYDNIQIYDRHIDAAIELLNREPINCEPEIWINPEKTNFYDMTPEDVKVIGYPKQRIREKNPQIRYEVAI